MEIRKFKESDYEMLKSWYLKRGLTPLSLDMLPSVGFIVEDIAASFMYIADGKLALLEGSISNPSIDKSIRTEALSAIFKCLLAEAKEMGLKRAYSTTRLPVIAEYAKTLGFVVKPGSITLVKTLEG